MPKFWAKGVRNVLILLAVFALIVVLVNFRMVIHLPR
jgi:hypothetical protein